MAYAHSNRLILRYGSVIIVMGLILTSCGAQKGSQQGNKGSQNQDNQVALSMLGDIEKKNEQVIQLLNGPANTERGQQTQQGQQSQQSQAPQQSGGAEQSGSPQQSSSPQESGSSQQSSSPQESGSSQQSGSSGQGGGQQQGQQSQSPGPQESMNPIESPGAQQLSRQIDEQKWLQVDQTILELHTLFNDYMPSALKMSVDPGISSGAAATLNQMTKNAGDRKYMDVLLEANKLYKYICSFFALHQDKAAPVKMDLFYARTIILAGMVNDWKTADSSLKDLKTAWQAQRTMYSDKEKDAVAKLDFSIDELEKVIAEKNQSLVDIKGKILMQNISSLEKKLK